MTIENHSTNNVGHTMEHGLFKLAYLMLRRLGPNQPINYDNKIAKLLGINQPEIFNLVTNVLDLVKAAGCLMRTFVYS
jgi:hypothetical protein